MNQYKICMGMWNFLFFINAHNISRLQQRDKKEKENKPNQNSSETITFFF